ncbi:MAG: hypothetical protein AAFQ66_22500, partial [Pseudomonadota bacterium]
MPIILFLSGGVVPLPLFDSGFQQVILFLPFSYVVDVPIRIYLGLIEPNALYGYAAIQISWIMFFVFLGRLVTRLTFSAEEG